MSAELKKRIFITLALLLAVRILHLLPIPGINLAAIFAGFQNDSPLSILTTGVFSRATIGTLGLMPYLSASLIATVILYFRRFRHGIDDRDVPVELYTLGLASVLTLLQSYGIAIFWENFHPLTYGLMVVPEPGWGFRLVTMLSLTAGTFLMIWFANLISQKGIGNGVCLIVLGELLHQLSPALHDLWPKLQSHDFMPPRILLFILLVAALSVAVLTLIAAKWQAPIRGTELTNATAPVHLRINGVGVVGIIIAQSLLFLPLSLAVILPAGSPGQLFLQKAGAHGALYWFTFAIMTFLATYFWTAWAYRPQGLQFILKKFYQTSAGPVLNEDEYERKLAVVTLLWALGLPFICGLLVWLMPGSPDNVLLPAFLFPIAAIALDLFRQFKTHQRMAAAFVEDRNESVCENCGAGASSQDQFCMACGVAFEENPTCDIHPATAAIALCVVCKKRLCADCSFVKHGRYVCEEHRKVELIEGWATALATSTRLEAELQQQHLERLGIPAVVLSNTIEPQIGTFGLFEINPVTPLVLYRELGSGRIRLLVPARELVHAQSCLFTTQQEIEAPQGLSSQ
ncbi:MAG: hypothetical protein ONB44_12330 [candidate division KSB1 bacterium]|nr:hypothetical protein [candidate division KSB1 bacterium]MDZ7302908.1 hypothetical protein [candidate division KSB1 bacterium]MDZ7310483.1 hypothetical protein [candidate division KSB1 bacterium]